MTSLIFFGSDRYSAVVLERLIQDSRIKIHVVVTDKQTDGSPVEKLAIAHNLKVAYYPDFDHSLITKGTLGLCASFDHLIPKEIIAKFGGKLYNLHPSLLPQYRNVSPVQYAIALGDKETGITLFRISPTIDDGEIIAQVSEPILPTDTTPSLTSRLFALGAELFIAAVQSNFSSPSTIYHLPSTKLIFTKRLTRASGFIEWPVLHQLLQNKPVNPSDTANELLKLRLSRPPTTHHQPSTILHALIRALTPWPGVWSLIPTRKGELRIALVFSDPFDIPHSLFSVLISGKPSPISLADFTKYYL